MDPILPITNQHPRTEARSEYTSRRHGLPLGDGERLGWPWGTTKKLARSSTPYAASLPVALRPHGLLDFQKLDGWHGIHRKKKSHRKGITDAANALPRDCYIPRKYDKHPQRQSRKAIDERRHREHPVRSHYATQPCREMVERRECLPPSRVESSSWEEVRGIDRRDDRI